MRAFVSLTAVAVLALFSSAPGAQAQNYDAAFQVRSGVFGQWGIFRGDAQLPASTQDFSFSSLGFGGTAGLEYVRRDSWSYGIEIDGGVLSGEERTGDAIYTPNYFASVRLRAGWHVRPDVFVYGTAGIAALGSEIRTPAGSLVTTAVKVTGSKGGAVFGFGVERDFGPGLWFAEYLYADYNSLGINAQHVTFDPSAHMLRVGIKFKVGHDHYHDDVLDRIGRRASERYGNPDRPLK